MKVALVCSWLNQYGGAERVLEVLHDLYPDAPVYTSLYQPDAMPAAYRDWDIRTSFIQRLPLAAKRHQLYLPLYPLAFEQLNLEGFDVVISNTSAFAHGVITPPETCHICYCLTPARFLWNQADYMRRERFGGWARIVLQPLLAALRLWDVAAANRVDRFVGISNLVSSRINKHYRRPADVIYPSVDTSAYAPLAGHDDFFLVVSRLVPYKRIELAVRACTDLRLPLKVVGDGRDRRQLQRMAGPSVEFLGRVEDSEVKNLYASCQALIFPGVEDFGLTPVEAQASGRPVIAFAGGGALETVVEGESGVFFREPTVESLSSALIDFQPARFDPQHIRRLAERFDVSVFRERFSRLVEESHAEHRGRPLVLRG